MPCPYLYLPPNLAPDSLPDVKNFLPVEAELGFIYLFKKCYLLRGRAQAVERGILSTEQEAGHGAPSQDPGLKS